MVMNITEIETIGLENVSDSYKTRKGIGLCFFDPSDEMLKEFDSTT